MAATPPGYNERVRTVTRIPSPIPKRASAPLWRSGYGGRLAMSMVSHNGIRDLARKARRGEELTDQEQGMLCLMCVDTGDATWQGNRIMCNRRRCKYSTSRPSSYFRDRRHNRPWR